MPVPADSNLDEWIVATTVHEAGLSLTLARRDALAELGRTMAAGGNSMTATKLLGFTKAQLADLIWDHGRDIVSGGGYSQ